MARFSSNAFRLVQGGRLAQLVLAAVLCGCGGNSENGIAPTSAPPAYTIETLTGTGMSGTAVEGSLATEAPLYGPTTVGLDSYRTVYIADTDRVRVVLHRQLYTLRPTEQYGAVQDLSVSHGVPSVDIDGTPIFFLPVVFVSADQAMLWFRTRSDGPHFADTYPTDLRGFVAADTGVSVQVGGGDDGQIFWASSEGSADHLRAGRPRATGKHSTECVLNDGGAAALGCLKTAGSMAWDERISPTPIGPVRQEQFLDLYVCDTGNHRIRKIAFNGVISTVAGGAGTDTPGDAVRGFSGDGGPATHARLNEPRGVAIDDAGNLYVADAGNLRVRRVDTSGIIATIAGTGHSGADGDGGPALQATFCGLGGLAVDSGGNVYVTDTCNYKIRVLRPIQTTDGNQSD